MTAVAIAGWLLALGAAWRVLALRRRLELVASAEHELRGPLAALTLAAARSRPLEPAVIAGQLDRARAALSDLTEARRGRRGAAQPRHHELRALVERGVAGWRAAGGHVTVDWRAGDAVSDVDAGRFSQALGNLLSNALEHGNGPVTVRGVRRGGHVRIEVANGRGRGLAIAARAAERTGGHLQLAADGDGALAVLELPLDA